MLVIHLYFILSNEKKAKSDNLKFVLKSDTLKECTHGGKQLNTNIEIHRDFVRYIGRIKERSQLKAANQIVLTGF